MRKRRNGKAKKNKGLLKLDFENITPEDIIGPEPIPYRDWSVRTHQEKPSHWHFHCWIRGEDQPCMAGIYADDELEAANEAMNAFLEDWLTDHPDVEWDDLDDTYCMEDNCPDCANGAHQLRLERMPDFPLLVIRGLLGD